MIKNILLTKFLKRLEHSYYFFRLCDWIFPYLENQKCIDHCERSSKQNQIRACSLCNFSVES
jgi:hypothetical protein